MAYTTIDNPTLYFNTKLYTGNGSTQALTGVGFQPDWVWIKNRTEDYEHTIFDSVRGVQNFIRSSTTGAEATNSNSLTAFGTDGFSIGTESAVNDNSDSFVSWNWLGANGTASNSDGSITSTVSANTTAGFSICAWNGNSGTVGHGLGVKPALIIIKSRQTSNNWVVLHNSLTGGMDTNGIVLNDTAAETSGGSGMAEPTSSVFTITAGLAANDNNIGYLFTEKKGYSKFGKYTGNGSTDGTFIYTGFKPAFIIMKSSSHAVNWKVHDNKRDSINNGSGASLSPNENSAEDDNTAYDIDLLSNGFKQKNNNANMNSNTYVYTYWAFAEASFVTAGTKAAGTAR